MTSTRGSLAEYVDGARNLGLSHSARYLGHKIIEKLGRHQRPFSVTSRHARFPLTCRPRSSDLDVFAQIYIAREYRCLDKVTNVKLVIDCGANVGMSSAYFLSRYPDCFVVAVEADAANYAQLLVNLAPYAGRYSAIQAAVWADDAGVVPSEHGFGDGREWGRSVRPSTAGEVATVRTVTIDALLEVSGYNEISILKVDIEGAETAVFSKPVEAWLKRTDNLVIELHGPECEATFMAALQPFPFQFSRCEELTVCQKIAQ